MEEQSCPRCKTTKYRNPKLKLLVNVCGHKICDSCVDVLFTRPSAACPECNTPLRRNDFRLQQFEDLIVEKEVDVRKKVLKVYNKREEDFDTMEDPLRGYNDYLEEVETIIWNLANGIEIEETKKKIEKYKKENDALIRKNNFKLGREEAFITSQIEEEQREEELRRKKVSWEEKEQQKKKKKEKEAFIDDLIRADRPIEDIVAEHASKSQKKSSLLFSSSQFTTAQKKDEFIPLPNTDVPLYKYVTPSVDTCGPPVPQMELLAARGYLKNIRVVTEGEKASGYTQELACSRAMQEAFSSLYL